MDVITQTGFRFPGVSVYEGKVRDVYRYGDKIAMVATDRISAFDVILPKAIPYKGQVLNMLAHKFLALTQDAVPNWVVDMPDPNLTVGVYCAPMPVEMVIRGYLAGHAWREYQAGRRELCGVPLPEGMKENDRFPEPIITPTTKAAQGQHDQDISKAGILDQQLVSPGDYAQMEHYTRTLFALGTDFAHKQGLVLVDTKYEFGKHAGKVVLIDEIHTPDSSRYFYLDGYAERQKKGEPQQQLSKEFVRQWLIGKGFQGKDGQKMPDMPDSFVEEVSGRYIELYKKITGEAFGKRAYTSAADRIEKAIARYFFG